MRDLEMGVCRGRLGSCAILVPLWLPSEPPRVAPSRAPAFDELDRAPAFDPTEPERVPEDEFDQAVSWHMERSPGAGRRQVGNTPAPPGAAPEGGSYPAQRRRLNRCSRDFTRPGERDPAVSLVYSSDAM